MARCVQLSTPEAIRNEKSIRAHVPAPTSAAHFAALFLALVRRACLAAWPLMNLR
eukprot:CAMPEP_0204518208 /NCGR_PEP_ID=MMETSP0661-20131031/4078_1 /ASSEMBLY_ACC=CAM_ASM_000606 /TAXON_ID=109239 /ORGANISM="Alexandrium margalefi, Strain AMGDE01CS-322" /LENGTH=54 /DNA_ID=CAMNT_0051523645 /DNA_START=124 /DNA_END=284 /DNA_ORIENTATION=+